jgi:nucleotide-binding universal stress UspA family protein
VLIMIKDLVVPITDTAGDANAVAVAVALATQDNAHLALLEFVNLPLPPAGPWGGGEVGLGDLYIKFRDEAEKDANAWRERLSKEALSLSSEVRVIESLFTESSDMAALHARYTDLAVMTMATDIVRDAPVIRDFFTSLLLESGRPVLLVPPGYAWRPAKHVVVAWQAKREATRALHDAMPFLHAAESIDVLEVGENGGDGGDGPQPGADIAAHLARHGLKVRVVVHARSTESVALSLVRHAQDTGAELIVAGGYGHSRFREWALGGVTRDLLSETCSVPILFSH